MGDEKLVEKVAATDPVTEARQVIPLFGEEVTVTKKKQDTGHVRVSTITREHEELVNELLSHEKVEVEKIAIGKPIESVPPVREDGDTIIIPVVEEVLVVGRHLVLKEEVRIRRVRGTERHQERVILRKQEAVITRLPVETQTPKPDSEFPVQSQDHLQEKK